MVNVTNHAMTRYAERIADRDTTCDINAYIVKNKEKIENDINTMLEHSQFLYYGKVGTKDNTNVNVYLSGTWVLLLDYNKAKVITLYKVDFNVGEDFNKQFIQRTLDCMEEHKKQLEEIKQRVQGERDSYLSIIEDNNNQITEYKNAIKKLERINTDYQDVVKNIDVQWSVAELQVKRDVENLILRKEF